ELKEGIGTITLNRPDKLNAFSPPLVRDSTTLRSHNILGTTPAYLANAVEMSMQVQQAGSKVAVQVDVDNTLTGHHVPTGVTVRNMILLVEAWPDGGDPAVNPLEPVGAQTIHDLGGVGDPAQGYYAGLAGKFYAKVNHDAQGNGPTFFTDATGITFDSRIPALTNDVTNYTFQAPIGGGLVQVRARLIYRRAFRFLVDAKGWTQDGHGNPLADVAAPHFGHLMESATDSVTTDAPFDYDGDGDVDLADADEWTACMTGPDNGPYAAGCDPFDGDGDDDVDLDDFGGFQEAFAVP
ncbi:MAG: hypothetical protein GY778_28585, partial [bacterium]|nr:hypothetical protein [bacterium]